ncbi:hypothetical protein BXZ70DRAFT_1061731 [Cristinia sonorae]|uniref:Bromo domain-containing protein n=1 Tax=Cristinia sonorae TaxID=1940300 RepID=A0A8K0UW89_9AGAR|nr:hypothetical protein BXZ70DRAFT_1061731 [Cristinia sonorae]
MDDVHSNDVQAESSQDGARGTGLKLVIPSLRSIQTLKGKKKGKNAGFHDVPVQKAPRPLKLKPLKEVLSKLISQIKKKDDYAFFLKPVDVSSVPGYSDLVKQPMDLGTMTAKVEKGKYRSLEEFATDLRLVTGNAKAFNPPGTIYYTEADRIEAYALQNIAKAAATVIEYETDWNIDVENEAEPTPNVGDEEEDGRERSMAMDVEGSTRARSPSVASTGTPMAGAARSRQKGKKKPGMLSESLEDDGHLPGYKDGVGVFPPDSEFSELMVLLKLKGKRYRTKKERMRIERGGPPIAADGSLDYSEMEDPFTILSILVPEPRNKPLLHALYPSSAFNNTFLPPFPIPVQHAPHLFKSQSRPYPRKASSKSRRKHWTITRMSSSRRAREANDDDPQERSQMAREHHHVDYGSFSMLVNQLAEESQGRLAPSDLVAAETLLQAIRGTVEKTLPDHSLIVQPKSSTEEAYWKQKAGAAEDYVRDVVYGGVEGLAYVRSVAAFVHHDGPKPPREPSSEDSPELGMPLADWVAENVIDPITGGRHLLLRETALHLLSPQPYDATVSPLVDRSLRMLPQTTQDLAALYDLSGQLLDMASLIKKPDELFIADDVWAGASYMAEQRRKEEEEREKALVESPTKNAAEYLAFAIQTHNEAEAPKPKPVFEGPDVLLYALNWSADAIQQMAAKKTKEEDAMDVDEDEKSAEEDAFMRKFRLNLLALSKRAPLDKVARLPKELVPHHIRHVIPTLESAS